MADSERIRPPWWLKPMNKIFIAVMRLGLPFGGRESPEVLTLPGRCCGPSPFRFDSLTQDGAQKP
jgi:hypothetical protein